MTSSDVRFEDQCVLRRFRDALQSVRNQVVKVGIFGETPERDVVKLGNDRLAVGNDVAEVSLQFAYAAAIMPRIATGLRSKRLHELGQNLIVPTRAQAPHTSEIDIPTELRLEKLPNSREGEQPDVALRVEVKNDVDIGFRDVIAAGDGAEERGVSHALGFERRPKFAEARKHKVAHSVVRSEQRLDHIRQFEKRRRGHLAHPICTR